MIFKGILSLDDCPVTPYSVSSVIISISQLEVRENKRALSNGISTPNLITTVKKERLFEDKLITIIISVSQLEARVNKGTLSNDTPLPTLIQKEENN